MVLGSTQPLTEMSTRNISYIKVAGALGWQTYHLHVPIFLKSGSLNLLEPSGTVQACNGIANIYTSMQGIGMKSYLLVFYTTRMDSRVETRNVTKFSSYRHRCSKKWLTIAREVTSRLGQLRGPIQHKTFCQWTLFRCYKGMYKWILHPFLFFLDSINDADFMKDSVTKLRINKRKNWGFGITVFLK